ncbi:hypothetical protein Hanom_Chr12g01081411 [Helianthus anomalus]
MEMSLLKALLKNIYAFLHLLDNKCSEIVEKYYIKIKIQIGSLLLFATIIK